MNGVNVGAALFLTVDLVVLAAIIIRPLKRDFDHSDKGAGAFIVLPRPYPASLKRSFSFLAICAVVSAVIVGLRTPDLSAAYRNLAGIMTEWVVHEPAVVNNYTSSLLTIIPISVVAYLVAHALTITATPGRRLVVLLHAPLFLITAACADTVLAIIGITTHLPVGPYPIVSIITHYLIAYLLAMRLACVTFQLPRPTQVPLLRRSNVKDDVVLLLCIVAVLAAVGSLAVWLIGQIGDDALVRVIIVVTIPSYVKLGVYFALAFLRNFGERPPVLGEERPLVEVIIPGFNEEVNIVGLLQSIDAAARVYGGPVRAIFCDDGSTDDTKKLALETIAGFTAAKGEVIDGEHAGKSTALNRALSVCTADIVVRIDSDCRMHPEALLYAMPWFSKYPNVGLVGAFNFPKAPYTSWVDRMRTFELTFAFGLPRIAYPVVDGIPCVPGTFTAFRRKAAIAMGGFAEGLFGEDVDLTCNLARLGWRAIVDRRVWSYEDVPNTTGQLRVQRIRWNRGGIQNFGRFNPIAAGFAGPRFWFTMFRRTGRRLSSPIHMAGFIYILETVLFQASYRRNVLHLFVVFLIAHIPQMVVSVLSVVFWRQWRILVWLPLTYWFAILKRFFSLEATITFPTRPVEAPGRRRRQVAEADLTHAKPPEGVLLA
jgi:cellulose synthase/poly-beta-1,6-N-acetylglucosamine synthase-like glycosyltransferase